MNAKIYISVDKIKLLKTYKNKAWTETITVRVIQSKKSS